MSDTESSRSTNRASGSVDTTTGRADHVGARSALGAAGWPIPSARSVSNPYAGFEFFFSANQLAGGNRLFGAGGAAVRNITALLPR